MSYQRTREAIFAAATSCASSGARTMATGRLTTREEAQRAFVEWQAEGGSGVAMRLTTTANGDVAAEFTSEAN